MRRPTRALLSTGVAVGVSAVLVATMAAPAGAMPERYADAGTIVWCEGEDAFLEALDTTMAATSWSAGIFTGESGVVAGDESALLVGDVLQGRATAHDAETGAPAGQLVVSGRITRGAVEVVSGWEVDPDGRRTRSEGTRIPLTGTATLTWGATQRTLTCTGWEIDLETFVINRAPAAFRGSGWVPDSYPLDRSGSVVGFYGDRKNRLGIALDLVEPTAFAGERLQVRNGRVAGTLVLRDPETGEPVGAAHVTGTVTRTGSERVTERGARYRYVFDRVFYDVHLTITTGTRQWSGTWPATHEVVRSRVTIPPRALH